jgi:D-alanyl-D-alanine carboxypeptidase
MALVMLAGLGPVPFLPRQAAAATVSSTVPNGTQAIADAFSAALPQLVQSTGTPGASATVRINGKTVWSGATGLADPAQGTPFTTDTLSSIASVSKLATAAMVTRLAERGLLSMDDKIADYVPEGLPGKNDVTVRQLIDMTAGYADVSPEFVDAFADPNHVWTRSEILERVKAPQFPPGSQFDYSNTNYFILGEIIDRVYPGGVSALFRDDILTPADLQGSMYFDRDPDAAPRVAHGFRTSGGITTDVNAGALDLGVNTSVWGPIWTEGGIVATADGVARFADALYGGVILNDANTAALNQCTYTFQNRCWSGFIGAFNGYAAFVMHDWTRGVTISAVVNALNEDTLSQWAFLDGLTGAYVAAEAEPAPVPLPGAAALMLLGPGALGLVRSRRRKGGVRMAAAG